jgi:hypothetical protein
MLSQTAEACSYRHMTPFMSPVQSVVVQVERATTALTA